MVHKPNSIRYMVIQLLSKRYCCCMTIAIVKVEAVPRDAIDIDPSNEL